MTLDQLLSPKPAATPIRAAQPFQFDAPIQVTIMPVTPAQAAEWLRGNIKNRKLKKAHLKRLVRTLRAGNQWQLTHQGIALTAPDASGVRELLDGQHRLTAIVEAGVTVDLMVTFNLPASARAGFDQGAVRGVIDIEPGAMTQPQGACTVSMINGLDCGKTSEMTPADKLAFYRQHAAAIDFALDAYNSRSKGLKRTQMHAVIARASYHIEPEVLRGFANVLANGTSEMTIVTPGDRTVLLLREKIVRGDFSDGSSGSKRLYASLERAVRAYAANRALKAIAPVRIEEFPLPAITAQ